MRLWSLHPQYLDTRGLVALWREALLAQVVLLGQTRGYTRHPQLIRFKQSASPSHAIGAYLRGVWAEADRRGYRFDASKIALAGDVASMPVTAGQLSHELGHLRGKLLRRAPDLLVFMPAIAQPHPLFHVVSGDIETWEIL